MAKWKEVTTCLEKEFSAKKMEKDIWGAVFPIENDRHQSVVLRKKIDDDDDTEIWLDMLSPIGDLKTIEEIIKAMQFLAKLKCGGIIKIDNIYYVRHSVPIEDLSFDELKSPMFMICAAADTLERELIKKDKY